MRNLRHFGVYFFILILISCGKTSENQSKHSTSVQVEMNSETEAETQTEEKKVIVFFGNSLTAGLGLDTSEAFPALIQNRLDSLGYNYQVVNAGLSGDTTASGKNRIDWVLNQEVDVFVLELGANDGLRGIPIEETRNNLQHIIDIVKKENPEVEIVLAGMQIPPNIGQDYTSQFREIFPELAKKNGVVLIHFLLEGVAGDPELNQQDGIHPTAEGYKIVRENVWEVLRNVVEK